MDKWGFTETIFITSAQQRQQAAEWRDNIQDGESVGQPHIWQEIGI